MSLKYFHILFILLAVVFSLCFGAWALLAEGQPLSVRGMGAFSALLGFALAVYGAYFVKKSRRIIT